jgi:hypothetical protein
MIDKLEFLEKTTLAPHSLCRVAERLTRSQKICPIQLGGEMVKSILLAALLVLFSGLGFAVQANCGDDTAALAGAKVHNPVGYTLPKDTRIKLSLDVELTSAWVKRHDFVQFLVAQNVYGVADDGERIVIVPAGSKVFGVADFTRSRYPFFIKGKAKLYVYVNSLILENGNAFLFILPSPYRPRRALTGNLIKIKSRTVSRRWKNALLVVEAN